MEGSVKRTPEIAVRIVVAYAGGREELAGKLGISAQRVTHYTNGYCNVNPKHIKAMCAITGGDVTPYQLRPDMF